MKKEEIIVAIYSEKLIAFLASFKVFNINNEATVQRKSSRWNVRVSRAGNEQIRSYQRNGGKPFNTEVALVLPPF